MKWSIQAVLLAVLMASLSSWCQAQSKSGKYDPAPTIRSAPDRDSFLDFTLARINPCNSDYGEHLSETRRELLDETVRNGYFWSNVVALVSLACLLLIIAYQCKVRVRREWATAKLLAQFEHALARSKAQLSAAYRNNNELTNELTAAKEHASRCISRSPELAESPVASAARTSVSAANPIPPTIASVKPVTTDDRHSAAARNSAQTAGQIRLFTPDVDLIMKVNSLEQQLAHSQRDNTALRRRIADGTGIRNQGGSSKRSDGNSGVTSNGK